MQESAIHIEPCALDLLADLFFEIIEESIQKNQINHG